MDAALCTFERLKRVTEYMGEGEIISIFTSVVCMVCVIIIICKFKAL